MKVLTIKQPWAYLIVGGILLWRTKSIKTKK